MSPNSSVDAKCLGNARASRRSGGCVWNSHAGGDFTEADAEFFYNSPSLYGGRSSFGDGVRSERIEVGGDSPGPLRAHQGERHARKRERTRIDQPAILEARIELALPPEKALEVVEARQVAAQEGAL